MSAKNNADYHYEYCTECGRRYQTIKNNVDYCDKCRAERSARLYRIEHMKRVWEFVPKCGTDSYLPVRPVAVRNPTW